MGWLDKPLAVVSYLWVAWRLTNVDLYTMAVKRLRMCLCVCVCVCVCV